MSERACRFESCREHEMKNIITILGAVLMIACCGNDPDACKTTSDCKDPKVCVDSRCTPPVVVVPQATTSASSTPSLAEEVKNDAEVVTTSSSADAGVGGKSGSGGKAGSGGKSGSAGKSGSGGAEPLKKLSNVTRDFYLANAPVVKLGRHIVLRRRRLRV